MVRTSKKPLITKNWMPVEMIHGVPNILTSRVQIAKVKRDREVAGKPPIKKFWCQYCGRPLQTVQALRGHLRFCKNREAYQAAMRDGFRFTVGSQSFIVWTKRWSWLREAVKIESRFNRRIEASPVDEADLVDCFTWYILGLQDTDTRVECVREPASAGV